MAYQRENVRINVPEGQRKAVVLYGTRQVEGMLVDESASGFAIRFSEQFHLPQGTTLKLRTAQSWTVVTVARCRLLPDGMEAGLRRQEDLPDAKELNALKPSWRDYLTTWRGKYDGMLSAVAVVVLGFGAWMFISYMYTGSAVPPAVARAFNSTFGRVMPKFKAPPPSRETVAARTLVTARLEEIFKTVKAGTPGETGEAEQVRADCARFARSRALMLPETTPALGLSKSQSQRIRQTVEAAEGAIVEKIRGVENDENRAAAARTWLAQFEAEVLGILTPEQRETWETMTAPFVEDKPRGEAVSSNSL